MPNAVIQIIKKNNQLVEVAGAPVGIFITTEALQAAFPAASHPGKVGMVGSSAPYEHYISNGESWSSITGGGSAPVINNLTSTSTSSALSAAQGKILKDTADALASTVASKAGATEVTAALTTKADLVGGKLSVSQVPDLALQQYLGSVPNQAAMLLLVGQLGDWCSRSDLGTDWRIIGDPSQLTGWLQTTYPSAPVQSVNSKTGVVILTPEDIGAATSVQGGKADTALQPSSVINSLSSVVTDAPLSAAQGKTLKDTADTLAVVVAGKANTSHSHSAASIDDSSSVGRALLTAASISEQRTLLGLGTAAIQDSGVFATSTQGSKADTASQPAAVTAEIIAAVSAHTAAAADPHPTYLMQAEGDSRYGRTAGIHATPSALESAFPAISNVGAMALVGIAAPYAQYVSDGSAWSPLAPSDVMPRYASTDVGKGASLTGIADTGEFYSNSTVEGALQEAGSGLRGRLRDVRTFPGIAADNTTNDLAAFQAACVTARATGCGIYFPVGVKVFLEFSTTTPHLFIDGKVSLVAADPFSGGLRLNCNYAMPAGHAPLICWGIPSKGAAVNKVSGRVSIGWWLTAGCGRFERANHIYGAQDFTVEGCWVDFTQVTWPAADAEHPSGYQAGGWFSSNVQGTFAPGQTQDRNIQFIRNVGFASAEYQNGESVGITRCKGLRYINNYFYGFADDLAAHECVDVLMHGNHYEAVTGRLYFDNCQHVKIVDNYITSIQKPSGGFVGPARTYITGNMAMQYAAITYDPPNYDVVVSGNAVVVPAGGYCSSAIQMYGVQDGLTITDNHFYMSGSPAAQAAAIGVSTLYRAGWTGPAGNPDYAAGGAVKLRSVTVRGNKCIGAGWGATDGNLGVVAYAGGTSSDIIGPVDIDGNIAGAYYIPYEPVRFGRNFATPAATDPFLNLSTLAMWDKQPPLWVGLLPASANINNTNFPQATPTFYTLSDSDGMKFIAQRAGRVLGAHMQLTANMTAGNNCVLRVLKNGTQIGTDTDSATNSPTTNPSRYIWNFFGVSGMTFVEGDTIELRVTIRTAQGATSIVGRINMVAQYM